MLQGTDDNFSTGCEHVAVIGGGRWGRVLAGVLCDVVAPSVGISIHSPRNVQGVRAWLASRGLQGRVTVSFDYPVSAPGSSCAIVANAACDHESAVEWALARRIPVLVEKPVTPSYAATCRLSALATEQGTYLAAAHVFLFARYVHAFSRLVHESGSIEAIRLRWVDPAAESRHGEAKSFDPGLTILADWLPHVVSILAAVGRQPVEAGDGMVVSRGGAHVKLELRAGNIPCQVELVRNGAQRDRLVEADTSAGTMSLDFAEEPGTIRVGSDARSADPAWGDEPRPVASMLRAFLQGASGGPRDARLDIEHGWRASRIVDELAPAYREGVAAWLREKNPARAGESNPDLPYAIREILHGEMRLSPDSGEKMTGRLLRAITSDSRSEYERDPVATIRLLAARESSNGKTE